jgi:hypothetical protein
VTDGVDASVHAVEMAAPQTLVYLMSRQAQPEELST